ncbi:GGDEF domain-containing protein [Cellulomonas sp. KRMCY2]|uniref:GGDEF domain-containing protein n=1 Tax=Cellulomonas sp. KRMCY2 TaxID=1304865 RepID=UPI001E5CD675|nr:GGDEF domain-containing protein [Cellulomonas sp. KRMCY2]
MGLAAARGRLHRRLGESDAAITALEAGLALGDDRARPFERAGLLSELVEIHEERGEHALALAAHRRLLTATLDQRDDAAGRRARALNSRLDLERAQVAAQAERLRSERLELLNRELAHYANHDALTGLVNRRGFDTALAARAALPDESLTYVLGDLDHFKAVNDDFSHAVGDEVLRRVAEVVRAAVRGTDLVARIGGEEIAVLLTDPASTPWVADVCERIRREIAGHPWDEVAPGLRVTISIGAASRRPDEPVAELAARADALMYEAKAAGRDRVVLDAV